jgi:hypothetical protein
MDSVKLGDAAALGELHKKYAIFMFCTDFDQPFFGRRA